MEATKAKQPELLLLDELRLAYQSACESSGNERSHLVTLGGRAICLRFATSALEDLLLPSLSYFPTNVGEPSLTVYLADSVSSKTRRPQLPWRIDAFDARGVPVDLDHISVKVAIKPFSGALSVYNSDTKEAFYWVHSADVVPAWEAAGPIRTILAWWAKDNGFQLAHAAAVGIKQQGIILTGKGGSGKSTTAASALWGGFDFVGDDYILLQERDGVRSAHSIFATSKLLPNSPVVTQFKGELDFSKDEKATIHLREHFEHQLVESLDVKAIVVPTVGSAEPALERLPASRVLQALAPTTLFQLPGSGSETFKALADWAQYVPGYSLRLSPDLNKNLDAIRTLLTA